MADNRREALTGYLFISPWSIGFLVFTAGAMIYSLVISFSRYNLATNTARPAGLDNYAQLFEDPRVATSPGSTLFYAVLAVPLEILVALGLASPLLNGNTGAIDQLLGIVGVEGPQWLVDPAWIKPSIVLMTLWGVSGTMVIVLAP